jgi:hypothetical protein
VALANATGKGGLTTRHQGVIFQIGFAVHITPEVLERFAEQPQM